MYFLLKNSIIISNPISPGLEEIRTLELVQDNQELLMNPENKQQVFLDLHYQEQDQPLLHKFPPRRITEIGNKSTNLYPRSSMASE
jgi:hypothetical protein